MVLAIAIATLTPSDQPQTSTPWYCLWCDEQALADAVVNVVMFIPLGIALRAAGASGRRAIVFSAALATTVEVLQGFVVPGRDPSLRDALTNTVGAAIGVWSAASWHTLVHPSRLRAALLAVTASFVWLSTLVVSGIAVQPCAPATPYDAAWSPRMPNEPRFLGRVVGATLYGDSLRDAPLAQGETVRRRFESGRIALTASVEPDRDPRNSATMLAVIGFQRIALSVSHAGRNVVLVLPQCGWRLRLRPTLYALGGGLDVAFEGGGPPRALVEVTAVPQRIHIEVERDRLGPPRATDVRITPFLGWSLVRPFYASVRDGTRWITALWLAGLLLPFGYFLGRCSLEREGEDERVIVRRAVCAGLAIAVLLAGLAALSRMLSLSSADWREWCQSVVGIAGGWLLALALARRESRASTAVAQERSPRRA